MSSNSDGVLEVFEGLKEDLNQAIVLGENLTLLQDIRAKSLLGQLVPELMDLAETYKNEMTGPERKQLVLDAVWVLYKTVDPNIPLIPEPFETKLERIVVRRATEAAIEAAIIMGKLMGRF